MKKAGQEGLKHNWMFEVKHPSGGRNNWRAGRRDVGDSVRQRSLKTKFLHTIQAFVFFIFFFFYFTSSNMIK